MIVNVVEASDEIAEGSTFGAREGKLPEEKGQSFTFWCLNILTFPHSRPSNHVNCFHCLRVNTFERYLKPRSLPTNQSHFEDP